MLGELGTRKTTDVFKKECPRLNLPHGAHGLGPQVTPVLLAPVQPADGKWLARRPPRHHFSLSPILRPAERTNIAVVNFPIRDVFDAASRIVHDVGDGMVVSLDKQQVAKPRSRQP